MSDFPWRSVNPEEVPPNLAPRPSMEDLIARFEQRQGVVGIIGLGYVGLPLAATFAEAGVAVVGFDIDRSKIEELRAGRSYIRHIASERLGQIVTQQGPRPERGKFYPTADFALLRHCDAILICVPTPLSPNRDPDLSYVERTGETIAEYLRPGQLVVLESTTYPGTTDEVLKEILERSGLRVGVDVHLAFSPEREDPNNPHFTTRTIPKLVGGVTESCTRVAVALYSAVLEKVVPVSSARVAEAAKLLENIYRCVNIALVNELKVLFDRMGIDIWEVIDAAATKPFGFTPFYPGPGLGGHCIPIDPFYLSWKAREYELTTRFIELAGEINHSMPGYVVGKIADALNERRKSLKGARVLVLGVAYKKDLDDTRESPALRLIDLLLRKGAKVSYHDPYVPHLKRSRNYDFNMSSVALTRDELERADAVVVATDHSVFDYDFIVGASQLVIDTRNATRNVREGRSKIVRA
ncbi:MAG: UDP-N-acetyl-D-glucosamine 6-dehydrogenase [Candidatus Binatia bacterium]|nr:MAG: UDP-N-acetyl-D-glucosamine 6-dehydrogenase [Candidatus Binatia bacterium]